MKKQKTYFTRTKKWHRKNTQYWKTKIKNGGDGNYYTYYEKSDDKLWTDFYFVHKGIVYFVYMTTARYHIFDMFECQAYDKFDELFVARFGHKEEGYEFIDREAKYSKSGQFLGFSSEIKNKSEDEVKTLIKEITGKEMFKHEYVNMLAGKLLKEYTQDVSYVTKKTEEYQNSVGMSVVVNEQTLTPKVISDFIASFNPDEPGRTVTLKTSELKGDF